MFRVYKRFQQQDPMAVFVLPISAQAFGQYAQQVTG
jgi:hypothetical protein